MGNAVEREREFSFTEKHFKKVKAELYDHAGIVLADHKQDMAYNRLVRRLRELDLNNFDHYFEVLNENPEEFSQFINALTTNLTAFFRENHHFEFVKNTIVPEVAQSGEKKLRIWSAGCSLGEEPYSLAIALLSGKVDVSHWDVRILATDIDSKVLNSAQSGTYAYDRVQSLSTKLLKEYFLKGAGDHAGQVQARKVIQELIRFKYLNLMQEWPMSGPFDFIFCRNVMIYFDKNTQADLLKRMYGLLKPKGYLFVGHSEALARHDCHFNLIGKTIYQKDV